MAAASPSTCVLWFRRDLRLDDNPALVTALQNFTHVVPVYVWAPEEEGQFQPGRQTRWWAKATISDLRDKLAEQGSRLILRRSRDSSEALKQVVQETGAQAVLFNNLYDSVSLVRDRQVKEELQAAGVRVASFNADLLYEPWEVLDPQGEPYTTFKEFWDRCLAMPYPPSLPLRPPASLPPVPGHISSLDVSEIDWFFTPEQEAATQALAHRWDPRSEVAHARLAEFLEAGLPEFEHDRAKTDRASTTMLSPWIHFGSLSVRIVYYAVAARHAAWQASGECRSRSCLDFLQQLGYREYSRYLAFHFPFITERSMLAHLRAVPWRLDASAFKAWRQGLTGYPLVDAGMRQLWALGWCHNRVRVLASSFLVKHLLLPWQWGLKHLWDCQIDADLECDALGWQYVAGCLADAHPFSYMMDPEKEAARFDPDGEYVRRWLPVLAQLPTCYIHAPWNAPAHVLAAAGVELGMNYPARIVLPDAARQGVAFASSVIDHCVTSSAGGAAAGGGSGTVSGGSSSTGMVMPRKEPYRAPTDEALLVSFLDAARRAQERSGGASGEPHEWQQPGDGGEAGGAYQKSFWKQAPVEGSWRSDQHVPSASEGAVMPGAGKYAAAPMSYALSDDTTAVPGGSSYSVTSAGSVFRAKAPAGGGGDDEVMGEADDADTASGGGAAMQRRRMNSVAV